jgi:trehalose 6-phosphate phosphatase
MCIDAPTNDPAPDACPPRLSRRAGLFLDLDGTLAPFAQRPQDVRLPSWVVPALQRLRRQLEGALAIVSGRPLSEVDQLLRPLRLPAAGVHGIERRLTDGRLRVHSAEPPPSVRRAAQALADRYPGLLLEPKPGGLALHYRVRPNLGARCRAELGLALRRVEDWELLHGHCVAEVKPRRVSKGAVVAAFMAEPAFAERVPVFVGDDISDEDGIVAAQAAGGVGVKVGAGASRARYRLANPDAVRRWLGASSDALDAGSWAAPWDSRR